MLYEVITSSGLDPLCAYRNQLLRVHGARVEGVPGSRTNPVLSQFYLFDTRIYASTQRLVDEFYKLLADKDRKKHYVKYVENVDSMVQHVLTSDTVITSYSIHYTKLYDGDYGTARHTRISLRTN